MIANVLDAALWVAALATAATATLTRRRTTAAAMFLVLGLVVALVWARLGAPDIALAEAAIASGVTGALLIAAVTEFPTPDEQRRRPLLGALELVVGVAVVIVLSVTFVVALRDGRGADRLGEEALDDVANTPVSHPITAVLLDFRTYDTLLEIAVLAAAAIAALAFHRGGRLDAVGRVSEPGPVLTSYVRIVVPLLFVVAAWVLVAGSTRTGGAFQSGAIAAGALVLLHLGGFGRAVPTGRWLRPIAFVGLGVFIATAVLTYVFGDGWLVMDEPWGGSVILGVEAALTVSIAIALAGLLLAGSPDRPADDESRAHEHGSRR
ncbi:DUF4040 domain-containing protein [Rhodococcus rhodnii]|uniref:DUF4040 domain-containing protein n=2 Tax=Rhodococcus rhodnii TaxID=38312 RepID=R7WK21_9NOCA|nr:hydrogenase subunit MbhD domain-containing protein [Rhodococcus rhodnii]EOM74319.1 hypothetical protein Rrhod_4463 [Rhodococcus rhodnii LMG 5362]TXG89547.1 DUF4040 domain-containing protein [Rhodococcus rhodnii]